MKEKTIYPVRSDYETDEDFFAALVEYGRKTSKKELQYISVGLDIEKYEKLKDILKKNNQKLSIVIRDAVDDYIQNDFYKENVYNKSASPIEF